METTNIIILGLAALAASSLIGIWAYESGRAAGRKIEQLRSANTIDQLLEELCQKPSLRKRRARK